MPAFKRGLFDIYKELLAASIATYRDEVIVDAPYLKFEVTQDINSIPELEPFQDDVVQPEQDSEAKVFIPIVCVYYDGSQPSSGATNKYTTETHTFRVEIVTRTSGDKDEKSEQIATRKCLVLIQLVKNAIYRYSNSHFGKKIGDIGKKTFPTVQLFSAQEDKYEESMIGATITFTMDLPFTPPDITDQNSPQGDNTRINQALQAIFVADTNKELFSALYEYF